MVHIANEIVRPAYPKDIEYYDPEQRACDSVMTAFLMYKIGAPERLWQPTAIDAISGRVPGQPTEGYDAFQNVLSLMENGAEVIEISPFDSQMVINDGLSYIEEHHKDDWLKEDPIDFYAYWTDTTVSKFVEATVKFKEQTESQFKHAFHSVSRQPDIDDIKHLTSEGYDVKCLLVSALAASLLHAVVVTEMNENKFATTTSIFDPNTAAAWEIEGPILSRTVDDFEELWVPSEGIYAVRTYESK